MKDIDTILSSLKLQLNIKHPSLEECYTEGYLSFLNHDDEEQRPYPEGSTEKESWLEGWWDAFYSEEPTLEVVDDVRESTDAAIIASNDNAYADNSDNFLIKVLEISGMIALSAFVGYQLFELVA